MAKRKSNTDVSPSVEECQANSELWERRITNLEALARTHEQARIEALRLKQQALALAANGGK